MSLRENMLLPHTGERSLAAIRAAREPELEQGNPTSNPWEADPCAT